MANYPPLATLFQQGQWANSCIGGRLSSRAFCGRKSYMNLIDLHTRLASHKIHHSHSHDFEDYSQVGVERGFDLLSRRHHSERMHLMTKLYRPLTQAITPNNVPHCHNPRARNSRTQQEVRVQRPFKELPLA